MLAMLALAKQQRWMADQDDTWSLRGCCGHGRRCTTCRGSSTLLATASERLATANLAVEERGGWLATMTGGLRGCCGHGRRCTTCRGSSTLLATASERLATANLAVE